MIEWLLNGVLLLSAGYLVWRTFEQVRRQRLSYEKLPFPTADFEVPDDELDQARGALVGIALGDALGAARESIPAPIAQLRYSAQPGLSRGVIRFMRRRGTVTDDTQQTWLVARAIDDAGFDVAAFRTSLLDWWHWRIGPGRGTERAIRAIKRGEEVPSESQGNGAAMRVAPLAVAFRDDLDSMLDAVGASAAVTHPNPEAVAGAEIVARITRELLLDHELSAEDITEVCAPTRFSEDVPRWRELLTAAAGETQLDTPTGWVFDTIEVAVALFLRFDDDWRGALTRLYELGGDTDTVGAILLSFVGARYGATIFDRELVAKIQGVEVLAREGAEKPRR